jgi:tetratricopeptide (TPR) repeat protein
MVEDRDNVARDGFTDVPPSARDLPLPEAPRPAADPPAEVIAPTPVSLRSERGPQAGRRRRFVAALTADALWVQQTWQLRRVPLPTVANCQTRTHGRELAVTLYPDAGGETLRLAFDSAPEGRRWHSNIQELLQQLPLDTPPADRVAAEGVSLLLGAPDVPHVVIGQVECAGPTARLADRGLQLRAGLRGADAVIWVWRQKDRDTGPRAHHASGQAIRVEDDADRQRLRQRWFAQVVAGLVRRMLLLLAVQAVALFLISAFCAGMSSFHPATGETTPQALASSAIWLGVMYAWPLVLVALLRVLLWPGLLRCAGLAVLAVTTLRGLTVRLAHLLALHNAGLPLSGRSIALLADPFDWAFIIIGAVLCVRAWRLAGDALDILPPRPAREPQPRRVGARVLLGLTAAYALALLGLAGNAGYQTSEYMLQPGIDPRREQEALLALNQGAEQANKGDLAAAELSLQRSLRLWEELTKGAAPWAYRRNLAQTLCNLGLIRHRQGRLDEAETYYGRAVGMADQLEADPQIDGEFRQTLAEARAVLADLRGHRTFKELSEKDGAALRKYEDGLIKAQQGAAEADGLYQEAIAVWEALLPRATDPEHRRLITARLASAYASLGEQRQQRGKRPEAEAALRKAIVYGEKAVELAPDRPLYKHNLEVARDMLDRQHEQELQDEVNRLCMAEHFADAIDLCERKIAEQEEQVRSGNDREAATRRLAYRVDRLAWFLAHCPDSRCRDTKAAVKRARQATRLQPDVAEYWYTLATVQYRNGDWPESLASLEQVKARNGDFDAMDWLLVAMNRHQLKQRAGTQEALGKAVRWIDERKRQAEDNAGLRLQLEMMRPALESLRREAETLLDGKDRAGDAIG